MKTRASAALSIFAVVLFFAAGIVHAAAASWKPEKNVEIIVGSSPGGGQDKTGRVLQHLLQDKRLIDVAATVVNKPGGGGAVAWIYLNQHASDGHFLAVGTTTLLTNQIIGRSTVGYNDITPVTMLLSESVAFSVREDSPIKNGKDLLERLKKDAGSVSVSIGSTVGGPNHISLALITKAVGGDVKKLKTVVFQGGGDAIVALLGGHIDLIASAANNVVPHLAAGKLRVIGVTSPQRLPGALAKVPTWKEQGVDVEISNWRMVAGPKGLNAAQVVYWENAFARLVQTEEWKKELAQNLFENTYMNSADSQKYLKVQFEQFRSALNEVGLAK
ncbi:MAG: tripartite tricarboxylate transporter substrate binding protein [Burkholderiales bacterium]